jgi:hypothetical protein
MIIAWALVGAFFIVLHYLKENEVKLLRRGELVADERGKSFNKEPEE